MNLRIIKQNKYWLYIIPSLFLLLSVINFYSFNYLSKSWPFYNLSIDSNHLKYIVRFFTFQIPALITIYSFVYREKKDASYSNLKTSRILNIFIWSILIALLSLFFSMVLIFESSDDTLISSTHRLSIVLIYTAASFILLIPTISNLFKNMDINYSLNLNIKKTLKHQKYINYLIKNHLKIKFEYNHLLTEYNSLINSNFQLLTSLMSKNNLSDIESELDKIYKITRDFHTTFINNPNINELISFLETNNSKKIDRSIYNRILKFLYITPKESKNNYIYLLDIYKNILLNYKFLIREASKHKVTKIQKQGLLEVSSLSPINIISQDIENSEEHEFNVLFHYIEELTQLYYNTLFEVTREFTLNDALEYTYQLEQISSLSGEKGFYDDINSIEVNATQRKKLSIYNVYISKTYGYIESVVIWCIEHNNIRFLTDTTSVLLKFYYSHVYYTNFYGKEIKKNLIKDNDFNLDDLIKLNKDIHVLNENRDSYFKKFVGTQTIDIIIRALHKSIEIGNYNSTGYLVKISNSHFITSNILDQLLKYIKDSINREGHNGYINFYHYSVNDYSKIHCLQKLVVLYGFQIKNIGSFTDYKRLIKNIFLTKHDLEYILSKVQKAEPFYGMIKINEEKAREIYNIYES